MVSDPSVTERLIDQPPGYDDASTDTPHEQFEIEEPSDEEGASRSQERNVRGVEGSRMGLWFYSVKEFSKQRISVPARYLIDPITNFFNSISMWFDSKLNRWINPLLARRFLVVLATCVIILLVRFKYSSSFGYAGSLRDHNHLRDILRSKINLKNLQETTEYFGKMPHYAGSLADDSTSNYAHDFFESLGLPSTYDRHDVFLSHGNVTLCELKHKGGEVAWSSNLIEGNALENITASQKQPITQMALVLPGEGEGQLVYANFGSEDDFKAVDCNEKIALVKYSQEPPGTVALRAEKLGAKGLLFMSAKHPTEPSWPEGSDYAADSVQQGSLGSSSTYPGDILSPGWPSSMQMTVPLSNAYIAHIPVAALSWNDAQPLLNSLRGAGRRMDTNPTWGNNGMPAEVTEWWTGPNPDYTVHLQTNPAIENRHEIRNVFGRLEGREMSTRAVIVGARLDAMCYGSTQLSGLNVMLEVARILADLKYTDQWQPLRSIYFTAWDATSVNYAGITEWVENVADNLSLEGVVYIDLDMGISGPDFVVQGNPIIEIEDLLKKVSHGDHSLWDAVDKSQSFQPIPGYGNHIAFESHTGVPAIRLGFHNREKPAPEDSCFDSSLWMSKFGDPDHSRHFALTELVSTLILELSDAPLLPFDFTVLGREIHRYINDIDREASDIFNKGGDKNGQKEIQDALATARDAASGIINAGQLYSQVRDQWDQFVTENRDSKTGDVPEAHPVSRIRMYWNEKVAQANKETLDRNGIAMRNWYKNHLFGPEYDYDGKNPLSGTFPAVRDALKERSREKFVETLVDAAAHIHQMAEYLADTLI